MAWKRHGMLSWLDEAEMSARSPCSTWRPIILLQHHEEVIQVCEPQGKPQAEQWSQDKFSSEFTNSDPNASNVEPVGILA